MPCSPSLGSTRGALSIPEVKVTQGSRLDKILKLLPRSDSGQSNRVKSDAHAHLVPSGKRAGRLTAAIGQSQATTEANADHHSDGSRGGDTGYGVYRDCIWDLTQLAGGRTIICLPAPGIGTENSQMSGG